MQRKRRKIIIDRRQRARPIDRDEQIGPTRIHGAEKVTEQTERRIQIESHRTVSTLSAASPSENGEKEKSNRQRIWGGGGADFRAIRKPRRLFRSSRGRVYSSVVYLRSGIPVFVGLARASAVSQGPGGKTIVWRRRP